MSEYILDIVSDAYMEDDVMKKFVIISTVLILLAAGAFGYSLYHYMQVTDLIGSSSAQPTEAATVSDAAAPTDAVAPAPAENTPDGGIFADSYAKAADYVTGLSTEQMVGQLLLGVCADTTTAAAEINRYSLAGMLFESGNFSGMSAEDITKGLSTVASSADIKPIFAAQEEGGLYTTVSDLSSFTDYDFNSPRTEFASGGLQAVEKAEDEKATMLHSLGFNLNLAPSVDLAEDSSQVMYSRSIDSDADTVAAYAEYAAKFDQAKGVSVALKHFPGYGTIPDSAVSFTAATVDDRPADTVRNTDYTPFKKGAEAGAHFIMMSNVVVESIDSAHTAALSPALHRELRDTVGFSGIIITDLLDGMDYSAYSEGNKPAVQAVLAGNDMILVRDYAAAYNDILTAVNAGTISDTALKAACTRVIAYKYTAGILQ